MDLTPVTSRQIKSWTRKDPILSRVMNYVLQGWPASNADDDLGPYFTWKLELSLHDECLLWGNRVVNRHVPAEAPLHPWEWPEKPWSRVHIDYAGPLHGKYMEVQVVNSVTSATTIEKLCTIFAAHGIQDTIVSDNGTPFTSEEFESFIKRNGIRHIRVSP
ncbi:unnamed protein product [Mytilus coruscus]|uniref:Integrase catalytic domain-containing protein n=1 Tax=Mytilus coruscus TaxID=42192 RepID=A0A6J8EBI3_MYTCO|nr:unnamed protein product [Mytilus coruscus]